MSGITLSSAVRQNLLALQGTNSLFDLTSNRLATGKKVNSALDNPNSFFTAASLNARAGDLTELLDGESIAVQTVDAASKAIEGITKLVNSAKAIAKQAQSTTDTAAQADLQAQFDDVAAQVDTLAADAGFNGINLLKGDTLTVTFNEDATSTLDIVGFDDTVAGDLAIGTADFTSAAGIQTSLDETSAALSTLRTQAKSLGSSLAVIQARQEFTKGLVTSLQVGADNLTLADINEEGANLTSLQTRQQLSTVSLSLASQAGQGVLRLF
jgi:flagellin